MKYQHKLILNYIISFLLEKGYSPTTREISAATGYSSTGTINHHLQCMRAEGIIDFVEGISRTITVPGYAVKKVGAEMNEMI